jgi:hypothetical protein
MFRIARGAIVALALLASTAADATVFRFQMSGAFDADFTLDTADPNAQVNFFDPYIFLYGSGDFDGVARSNIELVLYAGGSGGLDVYLPGNILEFDGPMLYNYPWSGKPVIVPQTFHLFDLDDQAVTLVVSDPSAAAPSVPEPASWTMMMSGFGLIGGALRSRRKVAVRFA